ncbi:hypothetical protein NFI96_026925, partial [Prochilodus magdalenae]
MAKDLVDKHCNLLAAGGFELRQWASNNPGVVSHLPSHIRSDSSELWLNYGKQDAQESTLGLHWNCHSDTLSYKHRPVDNETTTLRNFYKVLASQYDPLGYIIPYTTRAKILVQRLWDKRRDWDDPHLPQDALSAWHAWESELKDLSRITLPRCYTTPELGHPSVLTWLLSESCRFKVFVGTRVAEIQDLTGSDTWRYVPSGHNPTDDITRGKSLSNLVGKDRWSQGPQFLRLPPAQWPEPPCLTVDETDDEVKKTIICHLMTSDPPLPDLHQYQTLREYLEAIAQQIHGVTEPSDSPTASEYADAELKAIRQAQMNSLPSEVTNLKAGKPVPSNSRLLCLAPEFDRTTQLVRVGGRLRRSGLLERDVMHPIVLDPQHPLTKLIIKDYDDKLHHPGPERVFAEARR